MRKIACALALVVAGCGGDDGGNPATDGPPSDSPGGDDAPIDTPPAAFTLTSTAYAEGGMIPADQTCDGANTSPQFDWTGAPAGALSFAMVFTDKTNGLRHSAIYDIPPSALGLPADVEKVFAPTDVPGAHNARSFNNGNFGYAGPCPPVGGGPHTYEQKLYALDVASLGIPMNSNAAAAETAVLTHDIASTTLTATYER